MRRVQSHRVHALRVTAGQRDYRHPSARVWNEKLKTSHKSDPQRRRSRKERESKPPPDRKAVTHELRAEASTQVDVDGAIRETAHEAIEALRGRHPARLPQEGRPRRRRRDGRRRAAQRPHPGRRDGRRQRPPPAKFGKGDIGILNYALTLEYLEAAFYNEATANNKKKSFLKGAAGAGLPEADDRRRERPRRLPQEGARQQSGRAPRKSTSAAPPPTDDSFIKTAVALENTGVGAYSGQALNIASPAYIAAALSIWSIEARHASVAGLLLKPTPANISPNGAFDKPKTAAEVLKAVEATGFLK